MKQVSLAKVFINFECLRCKTTEQHDIMEIINDGVPYCVGCGETMEPMECEIDTL